MTAHADLLTRLIVLYWREGVSQGVAAKLVGIRRNEFVELAELRKCATIIEAATWRYFLVAFNGCFPECDRRTLYRPVHGFGTCRQFTDAELLCPPKRDG